MSKQRDDLAKDIYLKRLPTTPITEQSKRSFESAAEQAYEMADVFLAEKQKQNKQGGVTYNIEPLVGDMKL